MRTEIGAIVQRVRNGDIDGFAEIVTVYQAVVWRVASYALLDRAATEDLVQQTFVDAYRHLDRFDVERDMGAWLCGIARNLVREELRRKARFERRFQPYAEYLEAAPDVRCEDGEREIREVLQRCRQDMIGAAGTALDLRYEQGLSFEEMAARFDRTVPAVRQLLQRARLALRECIARRMTGTVQRS